LNRIYVENKSPSRDRSGKPGVKKAKVSCSKKATPEALGEAPF